jgi:CheY-like chemotaxis protein
VVLVINDDSDLLDAYESALLSLGHEPVTKVTMSSGPETVRDVGADALVVDLQRPDEDDYGLRIIEELRSDPQMRSFPVILCSGAVEVVRSLRPRLDELGVPIVVKPFSIQDLDETLTAALGRGGDDEPAESL